VPTATTFSKHSLRAAVLLRHCHTLAARSCQQAHFWVILGVANTAQKLQFANVQHFSR
jgi:hypothetical protein